MFYCLGRRGTHSRLQRNRSILRRAKRLGRFWAPKPGFIYITKIKPGDPLRAEPATAIHESSLNFKGDPLVKKKRRSSDG